MANKSIVSNSKLDALAKSIAEKAGASLPMTVDAMKTAVDGIEPGGGGIDTIDADIELYTLTVPYSHIRNSAFKACIETTSITFMADSIILGGEVCYGLLYLASVTAPNATVIYASSGNEFKDCKSLKEVELPFDRLSGTFSGCYGMTSFTDRYINPYGSLTNISDAAFYGCSKLVTIDMYNSVNIGAYAMSNCTLLENLIIRGDKVSALGATTAFNNCTKFTNKTAKIYVPDALVEDYKAATNWTTYADLIHPLSEYTE